MHLSSDELVLWQHGFFKLNVTIVTTWVLMQLSHVKPLVVGHWGTTPGQNFIYVHLNRVIKEYDLDMFYIAGPGHGGPALVGNTYLEGSYSAVSYTHLTLPTIYSV